MIVMSAKTTSEKRCKIFYFLFHITPNLGSVLQFLFLQNCDEAGDIGGGGGDGGGSHGGGDDEGGRHRGGANELEASLAHRAGR